MQIKGLHKNIYKLASYTLSQEKLDFHRKKYEKQVKHWQNLKSEGVSDATCHAVIGISRATYYRYKEHLAGLAKGVIKNNFYKSSKIRGMNGIVPKRLKL